MKMILKILLAVSILLTVNACKKTYEDGLAISLRSKMNRITGKWRLMSLEGVDRLNPSVEQYMELTKDEISDGVYIANFTNFQEEFGCLPDTTGEALFTAGGSWQFFDGAFGSACNIGEYLDKNEGLVLIIDTNSNSFVGEKWKILRLTNKELKIVNNVCIDDPCLFYWNNRTLTFEKE